MSVDYAQPQIIYKRSLTNENYTQMLRIIALSIRPMSSYEIKKEMENYDQKGSPNNYVYEMIKLLVPKRRDDNSFLFNIRGVLEDRYHQKVISTVLNRRFNLGWSKEEIEDENSVRFTRINDDTIEIQNISNSTTTVVRLNLNSSASGMLEILHEDERNDVFPLTYHNNPEFHEKADNIYLNKVQIGMNIRPRLKFLDRYFRPSVDYLKVRLDTKWLKVVIKNKTRINEIVNLDKRRTERSKVSLYAHGSFLKDEEKNELNRLIAENAKIENDERKWRYDLNIRGFILYILGEINLESKSRKHNKRISRVLQYMQKSKADKYEFPFLRFYDTFREKYKQIEEVEGLSEYYEVELLKRIALELQFLVHTADIELLNYWVTRRFSGEITYYIVAANRSGFLPTFTHEEVSVFGEYQIANLQVMSKYLSNDGKRVDALLKELPQYPSMDEDLQIYF